VRVRGKTGSALNAKGKQKKQRKKCFQLLIDPWTCQGDDIFKPKMVKYLTCEPKLEHMMEVK
jgi:hypothetical protein